MESSSPFDARGIHQTTLGILCVIAQSRYPPSSADVRVGLNELGYNRSEGSHRVLLQKMLRDGLIAGTEADMRYFRLTTEGYELLLSWLRSAKAIVETFGSLLTAAPPKLAEPTHVDRPQLNQRLPSPDEMKQIIALSSRPLAILLRAYQLSGRSPTDLAELRIDAVDFEGMTATLPENAISGRRVKDRTIPLSPELMAVIREAIGERSRGFVFKPRNAGRWITDRISRQFRRARNEAGLPEEVLIMGRGGQLNSNSDETDD